MATRKKEMKMIHVFPFFTPIPLVLLPYDGYILKVMLHKVSVGIGTSGVHVCEHIEHLQSMFLYGTRPFPTTETIHLSFGNIEVFSQLFPLLLFCTSNIICKITDWLPTCLPTHPDETHLLLLHIIL